MDDSKNTGRARQHEENRFRYAPALDAARSRHQELLRRAVAEGEIPVVFQDDPTFRQLLAQTERDVK